jgi:hypothetical protein
MRTLLVILVSMSLLSTKAQSYLPVSNLGYGYTPLSSFNPARLQDSGHLNRKWQVRPYASVSAGYIFVHGGISYLSAPVGLMVFRPLTSNISAFAGVSAVPTVFSINRLYSNSAYPGNNFSRPYGLGLNGRIEGGLIYTNDAKTFSISGSVGIERGSYPVYPSNRTSGKRQ